MRFEVALGDMDIEIFNLFKYNYNIVCHKHQLTSKSIMQTYMLGKNLHYYYNDYLNVVKNISFNIREQENSELKQTLIAFISGFHDETLENIKTKILETIQKTDNYYNDIKTIFEEKNHEINNSDIYNIQTVVRQLDIILIFDNNIVNVYENQTLKTNLQNLFENKLNKKYIVCNSFKELKNEVYIQSKIIMDYYKITELIQTINNNESFDSLKLKK